MRVFVTGIGSISSIGTNVQETLQSLMNGRSGVGKIRLLDTKLRETLPAAEINLTDKQLKELAGISDTKFYSRTSLLGIIATKDALNAAGITNCREFATGLIGATSVGGMDKGEVFYNHFFYNNEKISPAYARVQDCGDCALKIAEHVGIKDYISTISTACSSSANSIMQAARMIKAGMLDRAVAGGADSLSLFTINGFNSLMILSDEHCKPFDNNRKGLNLGEGAGFLVLESEKVLKATGKKPLAEVTGFGNACDAHHQTASSADGQGALLAMQKALDVAGLKIKDIDYINVHGTGTLNNDLSEGVAIERLFQDNVPSFSSTKSYTGHTLAAAGGIEAVISVLSIQNSILFPVLKFETPMEELSIQPVRTLESKNIRHVMSNSFGFGGNNSSLVFSKC